MMFIFNLNTCAFAGGGVNANNWIGINMLVIITFFTIAGLIYAVSNLLSPSGREKLRTIAKFEVTQMMISIFLIIILVGIASLSCNVANSIAGMDTFEAAEIYIARLLFSNGINLATYIYSTSIEFMIASEIASVANSFISTLFSGGIKLGLINVKIVMAPSIENVYLTYSSIIVGYNVFVIITFGMLFLQFLLLFIIKAIMLTVVLPVAIIMRSLSFLGPRLRESANAFLALAIAFYFVFPLTFVMDSYIVNWTYCSNSNIQCNPYYSEYPLKYIAGKIPPSSLFTANPSYNAFGYNFALPPDFYSTIFSALPFTEVLIAPQAIGTISQEVSDFVFQGIFLMALNMGITMAFAMGITKALNAGFGLRGERIWA